MFKFGAVMSLLAFVTLTALFQNCSEKSFSTSAADATLSSSSANGSITVTNPNNPASGTVSVPGASAPAPQPSGYCGGGALVAKSSAPCLGNIGGDGTSTSPFEIRTAADFACVNKAPNAYCVMKADVAVKPSGKLSTGSRPLAFIDCFSGVFDGQYHRVTYAVDCQVDNCDVDGVSSADQKDVTLIEIVYGATVSNLRISTNYKNVFAPYKASFTQYVSPFSVEVEHSHLSQIAVTANIDADGQGLSGFANSNDNFKSGAPLSFYDQIDVDLTVNPARTMQYIAGLNGLTYPIQITNSHAKLTGLTSANIQTYGGLIGPVPVATPSTSVVVSNSFVEGDVRSCTSGTTYAPFGLDSTQTRLNALNSFSTGSLACAGGTVFTPSSQRADLTSVLHDLSFSASIWMNGGGGKPSLIWMSIH